MKKIKYIGLEMSLIDSNSTGNYRVYRTINGYSFMFSYESLIAICNKFGHVLAVTNDYRYSNTTGKHLYKFCDERTITTAKEVRLKEAKISSDERAKKVNDCLGDIKRDIERWS